jgi:hypothetical protein
MEGRGGRCNGDTQKIKGRRRQGERWKGGAKNGRCGQAVSAGESKVYIEEEIPELDVRLRTQDKADRETRAGEQNPNGWEQPPDSGTDRRGAGHTEQDVSGEERVKRSSGCSTG